MYEQNQSKIFPIAEAQQTIENTNCDVYKNVYHNEMGFEWDINKAAENEGKHGVSFDEAVEVFNDPYAIEFYDVAHSNFEDRYKLLGMTSLRILLVIYAEVAGDVIRIISARKATTNEKKQYEKQIH